jgi:hypothetical protein
MFSCNCLDQRDPRLFHRGGIVPHTALNDKELARANIDAAAIGIGASDAQAAAKHQEKFILALVRMPWELALDARYFYKLIVDLTHNSRRPQLGESLTREFERNWKFLHWGNARKKN